MTEFEARITFRETDQDREVRRGPLPELLNGDYPQKMISGICVKLSRSENDRAVEVVGGIDFVYDVCQIFVHEGVGSHGRLIHRFETYEKMEFGFRVKIRPILSFHIVVTWSESWVTVANYDYPCHKELKKNQHLRGDHLELLKDPDFSDVVFRVEGEDIHAHKAVLAVGSSYFKNLFRSKNKVHDVIQVPNVSVKAFKIVLGHIYGESTLSCSAARLDELATSVLPQAHEYQLDDLVRSCGHFMSDFLNVDNVCDFFTRAHRYEVEDLKHACVNFMGDHHFDVIETEGWKRLSEQPGFVAMELVSTFLRGYHNGDY